MTRHDATTTQDAPGRGTLLDELDSRQDDVIRQLEDLNDQVETLLGTWSQGDH